MESLASIATRANLKTFDGSEKITSISSASDRRKVLYFILTEYREAVQHPALSKAELEIRINSWLPITAPVPADRLHDCYIWAMQNRASQFPLTALELVDAWKHLQQRNETEGSTSLRDDRLLPENAAAACQRCFGTDEEQMPDGSVKKDCSHLPLSDEEKRAQAKRRVEQVAAMRAALKAPPKPKPVVEAPVEVGQKLHCSNCNRKVNTLAGWSIGETCGIKLDNASEFCPNCETPTGVLSINGQMICQGCFKNYPVVTCDGLMESPHTL